MAASRLDEREEDFYQALYTQSQAQFNTYVRSGTVLNNYAHIFDILIRLRQAVDHPYLVIHSDRQIQSDGSMTFNSEVAASKKRPSSSQETKRVLVVRDCPLCMEEVEDGVRADCCGAAFCRLCISDFIDTVAPPPRSSAEDYQADPTSADSSLQTVKSKKRKSPTGPYFNDSEPTFVASAVNSNKAKCPSCKKPLTVDLSSSLTLEEEFLPHPSMHDQQPAMSSDEGVSVWDPVLHSRKSFLGKIDLNYFQTSTKMEALMQASIVALDFDSSIILPPSSPLV